MNIAGTITAVNITESGLSQPNGSGTLGVCAVFAPNAPSGSAWGLNGVAINPLIARTNLKWGIGGAGSGSGDPQRAYAGGPPPPPNTAGGGGGLLTIEASGTFTITGAITANGDFGRGGFSAASQVGGGGAGGILMLASKGTFTNMGTISANGGSGGNGNGGSGAGGGGGGGIIHILAPAIVPGTIQVNGGAGGTGGSSFFNAGGGGACGGNGGSSGQFTGNAGIAGQSILTIVADPSTVFSR